MMYIQLPGLPNRLGFKTCLSKTKTKTLMSKTKNETQD